MDKAYHVEITNQALADHFSPVALEDIIAANIGQDKLRYQIGRPHFHYDDNTLAEGDAYIDRQRELALTALSQGKPAAAWAAFGRLIHTAQDFYAHSNYVRLYLEHRPVSHSERTLTPRGIPPLEPAILNHPALHTGRLYYPWEALSFLGFARLMRRLLPGDSHTRMHLDNPKQGPLYEYAFWAAVKRTQVEFEGLWGQLSDTDQTLFAGRER